MTPDRAWFKRAGVLLIPRFLGDRECRRLRTAMDEARTPGRPATVGRRGDPVVDRRIRRTDYRILPAAATAFLESRLDSIRRRLEAHFGLRLTDRERPNFLRYQKGDFFALHRDKGVRRGVLRHTGKRRVSVVLFLNRKDAGGPEPGYGGGELILYGLLEGAAWKRCGMPIQAEPGLLVAFRSELYHQVAPVTAGRRYTAVTWFSGALKRRRK